MNAANPPADDESFADLLISYEAALKEGSRPDPATVPAELRTRLEQGLAGLQLVLQLAPGTAPANAPLPWRQLGRFELRRELGRGSFGIVFLAHDPALGRDVALKVPRPEVAFTPELLERFRREARAVAGLEHPGIVPVHEVGTAGPVCYLVSAYCPGPTLAAWLLARSEPTPFREAATLLVPLAQAIQHAHARGIVHRDLKPANVLMTVDGDQLPMADGASQTTGRWLLATVPKITDFGLAKILREAATEGQTQAGAVLGTVCYMAPEQAAGHSRDVGPAADIYSLGAILYELLTRQPPFRGETDLQTLQQIQREEPIPVGRFRPGVPRDLETICLKALAREPQRRYATAGELAADLGRFLAGEPVQARPPGRLERWLRWTRRYPSTAALLVVSAVALMALAGLAVGAVYHGRLTDALQDTSEALVTAEQARGEAHTQQQRAEQARAVAEGASAEAQMQRQQAEEARAQAEHYLYFLRLQQAHIEWKNHHFQRTEELLEACPAAQRQWEWHYLKRLCHAERLTLRGHTGKVMTVAWSPRGNYLASGDDTGVVIFWERATGKVLRKLLAHKGVVRGLAFSPDGSRLATGGSDRLVKVWDPATGTTTAEFGGLPHFVTGVCFSADGRWLACSCGEGSSKPGEVTVRAWDLETGKETLGLDHIRYGAYGVAFDPRGQRLAVACWEPLVQLVDVPPAKAPLTLRGHARSVFGVAFSPDGKQLASGSLDHTAKIWNAQSGQLLFTLAGHTQPVNAVAYNHDSTRLATVSHDQTVRVWNASNGQELIAHQGHTDFVLGVAFSPQGDELATASADRTVKIWDARNGSATQLLATQSKPLSAVACSPDGHYLAYGGDDLSIQIWDRTRGQVCGQLAGHTRSVQTLAFHPDGRLIASAGKDGAAYLWDRTTGRSVVKFRGHTDAVMSLAFAEDGKLLVTASWDGTVRVWGVVDGKELRQLPVKMACTALAVRGTDLAVAVGNSVQVWDLPTGKHLRTLHGHQSHVNAVAFHPEGRFLASTGRDRSLVLWDVPSGKRVGEFEKHAISVNTLAFTADGQRLATGCYDGTIRIWDLQTRQATLTLGPTASPIRSLVFTTEGRLITADEAGAIIAW